MKHKTTTIIAFSILLLFLISYMIPGIKGESSENRTLATFGMVLHPQKDSIVYRSSPVERLDAALSDQFAFRESAVKQYLRVFNLSEEFTRKIVDLFKKKEEHQYSLHSIGNYAEIEDTGYITAFPQTEPFNKELIERHIEQIETLKNKFPDLKMYVYYVTQAYDTSWFDDYVGKTTADHFKQIEDALPDYVRSSALEYKDLQDYMDIHYKSDHHWNHKGAQRGYEDVYRMLKRDFDLDPLHEPVNEVKVSEEYGFSYLGSYGRILGDLYHEDDPFSFYEYDLPKREVFAIDPDTMEEIKLSKLGLYDEYKNGEMVTTEGTDHYVSMYGVARAEDGTVCPDSEYAYVIRNTENSNGRNLLIVGDSYNRAMRDLLASHFDTTVSLDYRLLEKIPIDVLIEKYDIDALLISSHESMWNDEQYFFTFGGND